jgi:acetyl esterase
MEWFWDKFRANMQDNENSSFNLLLLNPECKIPKTIIVTAGFDPLSDEAEKYAFLLHQNNNYVKQLHYPSLFHGFASMKRLKAALKAVNDFLSEYKEIL